MSDDGDNSRSWFRHSDSYNLNNRVMITAIISLSIVVVIVTILHLYARFVLRRQARRRTIVQQLGLTAAHIHSTEPPKTGLDPSIIATLPIFIFKRTEAQDDQSSPTECAVCLSDLGDDEKARLLPNCKHTFHVECIDKWLSSQSTCPICRTEAEPRLVPEPREPPTGNGAPPTAPPLDRGNSALVSMEGTSNGGVLQSSSKGVESSSRLSSFRRILSREKSSPRIQSCGENDGIEDLERQ